jgi:hypothetical protein
VLGRPKVPPVDVIETGMGIIFPMAVGPGVGVGPMGVDVGVGVFVLGAKVLPAETCMEFAVKIIKTRAKTINVRKICFVCIVVPHLSRWMGSRIMQQRSKV